MGRPPASPRAEADQGVIVELKYINQALGDLKDRLDGAIIELAALRNSEIAIVKAQLATQAAEIMVIKDRAGRNSAIAGAVAGSILSLGVSLLAATIMHRGG